MTDEDAHLTLTGRRVHVNGVTYYFDRPGWWFDRNGRVDTERLHRVNGPAVVYNNGSTEYWEHGHRTR